MMKELRYILLPFLNHSRFDSIFISSKIKSCPSRALKSIEQHHFTYKVSKMYAEPRTTLGRIFEEMVIILLEDNKIQLKKSTFCQSERQVSVVYYCLVNELVSKTKVFCIKVLIHSVIK